jgi:cytochrome c
MIKRIAITLLLLLFFAPLPAAAAERGTAKEAQVLVEKAIARYKAVGTHKTFAEINNPAGPFVDRDLYVFVVGPDHKIMVGFKDVDGKAFGDEIIAASADGNWVEYKFENFTNKKTETKISFVKNVDGFVFGSGYYKP